MVKVLHSEIVNNMQITLFALSHGFEVHLLGLKTESSNTLTFLMLEDAEEFINFLTSNL